MARGGVAAEAAALAWLQQQSEAQSAAGGEEGAGRSVAFTMCVTMSHYRLAEARIVIGDRSPGQVAPHPVSRVPQGRASRGDPSAGALHRASKRGITLQPLSEGLAPQVGEQLCASTASAAPMA